MDKSVISLFLFAALDQDAALLRGRICSSPAEANGEVLHLVERGVRNFLGHKNPCCQTYGPFGAQHFQPGRVALTPWRYPAAQGRVAVTMQNSSARAVMNRLRRSSGMKAPMSA